MTTHSSLNHLLVGALLALWSASSGAVAFTVDSTIDAVDASPGDGVCASGEDGCTLRAAVMEANALPGPDTVNVPPGVYPLTIPGRNENAAAAGDLDVTDDLTLLGGGAEKTTIDAHAIDRVFEVHASFGAGSLSVAALTITGGLASDFGGGIACVGSLSVSNCTISGNLSEGSGGGISLISCIATIASSTISGNQAEYPGGGIAAIFGGELTLVGSTVTGNVGGGIYNNFALTVLDSTVSGNVGTGIFSEGGSLTVLNSTISGNVGSGISSRCDFFFCTTRCPCLGGDTRIQSSTVSQNSGGGIVSADAFISLEASVIANQLSAVDCKGGTAYATGGHNLDSDGTCNLTDATDLPSSDPLLGPLADNGGPTPTHLPLPGSPLIDAIPLPDCTYDDDGDPGTAEVPLAFDQRGFPRPEGTACDIGAVEVPEPAQVLLLLTGGLVLAAARRKQRA